MAPCILFSYAHPDDESFSGAGTAMASAAAGATTVLVTATLGDRGKAGDPPVCAPEDLAACRARELEAAARIIGFDQLHLLGYRDRELADAPPDAMRRALVAHLRRHRPAVVLTFDPNGYNTHPDHVAISRFTSDAVAAAADPRWYPEAGGPHRVQRLLWTPPVAPWNTTESVPMAARPGVDFLLDVSPWRDRRIAALRAHRSQHLSIDKHFLGRADLDRIVSVEIWRQAWGPAPRRRPANSILEGLSTGPMDGPDAAG